MEAGTITTSLATLTELFNSCMTLITGNEILTTCFVSVLAGVGFGLIARARHAAM